MRDSSSLPAKELENRVVLIKTATPLGFLVARRREHPLRTSRDSLTTTSFTDISSIAEPEPEPEPELGTLLAAISEAELARSSGLERWQTL